MNGVTFHCDGCDTVHTVACAIQDGFGTGIFECPFSDAPAGVIDLAWIPQDLDLAKIKI